MTNKQRENHAHRIARQARLGISKLVAEIVRCNPEAAKVIAYYKDECAAAVLDAIRDYYKISTRNR